MSRFVPHAVVLLAALIAMVIAPASSEARPDVAIGIEQFGHMENPAELPRMLDAEKNAGAHVIRYIVRWDWISTCDPTTRGDATSYANPCYQFDFLDNIVRGAEARNMKVIFSVYGTPKWKFGAMENYTGGSDAEYASFVADYANFVQAAATRYDGRHGVTRVEQWTIWNEPNGAFFQPRMISGRMVGPARYARLYDAAARRIKAVDPTLRVAPGPTAPHASSLPPMTFAAGVLPLLNAWKSPIDAWAHNAYTGAQSPFRNTIAPPYVGLGNLTDLTNLMDRYPASRGKPIWITEFGYQTGGVQKAIEPEQAPPLLADALFYAWQHPRIETFVWYMLLDDEETGDAYSFMSGLYYAHSRTCDGQLCAKPALAMYQHTIWASAPNKGVVTLWGQGRTRPDATRIFVQRPGDGWRAYYNTDTPQTGTVGLRMALPLGTIVMTCDVSCGPTTTIRAASVTGGGGAKIQKLRSVRLGKRASLRSGIIYSVNCTRCTVSGRILARGRLSGIRAAARRTVIVGRSRVRSTRTGKRVHLIFTRAARRELARKRTAVVTLRTYIRHSNGTRVVTDRPVRLS